MCNENFKILYHLFRIWNLKKKLKFNFYKYHLNIAVYKLLWKTIPCLRNKNQECIIDPLRFAKIIRMKTFYQYKFKLLAPVNVSKWQLNLSEIVQERFLDICFVIK